MARRSEPCSKESGDVSAKCSVPTRSTWPNRSRFRQCGPYRAPRRRYSSRKSEIRNPKSEFDRSTCTETAALSGAGQARDLSLHARRSFARRYVRSQTETRRNERQAAAAGQAEIRIRPDRQLARLAVEVPEARPKRNRSERVVSKNRRVHR